MPTIPFYSAGQVGIIKDVSPHELPPNVWSDGLNMKFHDGKAIRRDGDQQIYPNHLGRPFWAALTYTTTNVYWLYADMNRLYLTDGAAHAEVTRASGIYGDLNLERLWSGGMFQGIPVFTNGNDIPQYMPAIALSNDFVDLVNWPVGDRANAIRPFKNFLVAMVITRGGATYPHMIKWSHPADPGSVPTSWDHTDPSKLAGERDLVDDFPGGIREALILRDMLVIYKDNSVWGMQYIGGTQVFRTYQILTGLGIMGSKCVASINEGRQHIFAASDDLIKFDGQNTESVLDKKWKTYLETHIDPNVRDRSFVFALERTNEASFCYPEVGHTFPNMALIWNWKEDTITQREVADEISSAALGPVAISGDPWDLDLATWNSDTTVWDLAQFRSSHFDILATRPGTSLGTSKILQLGTTQQFSGVDYRAFVERTDIPFVGQDRMSGAFKADFEMRKIYTRVWPRIEGAPVQIQLGAHEALGEPVVWGAVQTFTPGVDRYLDWTINGRLGAIRIESNVAGAWTLHGYNMQIEPLGEL